MLVAEKIEIERNEGLVIHNSGSSRRRILAAAERQVQRRREAAFILGFQQQAGTNRGGCKKLKEGETSAK